MNHLTPASKDPCQGDAQRLGKMSPDAQTFQKAFKYGKSAYVNINVDSNIHYDVFEDVYVPGEFRNPDTSKHAVSLEQYDEGYIRPNADLETGSPIRSKE